ncbi:hypothetical protein Franean1_2844 [Parafrankia sp. EAN1pec]|uniref:hypothetical protein n=1 Tax=Parafrankia sp. (strain EAN1pec) TaxID=298653 RepID=UPI0000542CE9|nr:hypothetical protein Franean1_2844 [Frankia sp. EAN1pec]
MSPRSACSTCWRDGDVRDLLSYADGWITAATAELWPHTEVTFGTVTTAGGALYRQVRAGGGGALCATVRPAGRALSCLVRGDHGDLTTVLADGDGDGVAVTAMAGQAEQLTALAGYTRLRVAAPIACAKGVMFTPWVAGTTLATRLRARPMEFTGVMTALMDDLSDLYRDPPAHLSEAAAPAHAVPRVVAEALSHPVDHLHAGDTTAGEIGELRALAGSLSARLGRLAARLDPMVLSHSGIAFGNLTPRGVLYPDRSPRATLVSPALEPGGDLVDAGTLLGHLHLLVVGCQPSVRAELVEGVEAWLSGRLAACRDQWRGWLHVVLTVWAATVYNQMLTELTLPAAALRLDPATADLPARPLSALSVLDALTRELRRRGAGAALNATLGALADSPASQPAQQLDPADH